MLIKSVALRKNWTQKQMSVYLGISEQYAGYIVKGYVSKVSFNHLFDVLIEIEPNFVMLIALDIHFTRTIPPAQWNNY